jgi:hypothetical protein
VRVNQSLIEAVVLLPVVHGEAEGIEVEAACAEGGGATVNEGDGVEVV